VIFVHPERAALTPGAPIVVGTDFSPQSIHATHLACALASRLNSPLYVIHANPNPAVSVFEGTNVDVASLKAEAFAQARKQLEDLVDELQSLWRDVNGEVTAEFPAEALLSRAEQLQADHLVVGFSGETPLMQHVLGSTALKCLNKTHCNLVLVPMS
jgi:nucleotide-binding universal stress UspA family protein